MPLPLPRCHSPPPVLKSFRCTVHVQLLVSSIQFRATNHGHTQPDHPNSRTDQDPERGGSPHEGARQTLPDAGAAAGDLCARRRQRGAPAADVAGDRAQLPPGRAGDLGRDVGEGEPRRRCGLRFHRGGRVARQALHRDAGGARRGPQHCPGRGRDGDRHRARAGRARGTRGEHRGDPAPLQHLARDAGQSAVHPGAGQARIGPGRSGAGQGRRGGARSTCAST